jgi:hypothetical protein
MDDDLHRQMQQDYMAAHMRHIKEQQARQQMDDLGGAGGGDLLDGLFAIAVVLFVLGFIVYAIADAVFN